MTENRKRIGVFLAQPESNYQTQLVQGIACEAFRNNMDVLVFGTYLKNGGFGEFIEGEKNIYRLPNMELLDAVIAAPDTIQIEGAFDLVSEKLKDYNKPVVYVDYDSDKYRTVRCNDYANVKAIIEHLVNKHGCKEIAFVSGPKGHPHAEERLKAYRTAMAESGLEVSEDRIFYGDFWYYKGEEIAEKLVKQGKLPDAVACANDPMGLSLLRSLAARGIKTPDDILITGYDSDGDGIEHKHNLTSKPRSNFNTGVNAVRCVVEELTGKKAEYVAETADDIVITNSCGCKAEVDIETAEHYVYRCAYDNSDGFYSGYNFMLESILGAEDLRDCIWKINWYTHYLDRHDGLSFCMCDGWDNPEHDAKGTFVKIGYTKMMNREYEQYQGEESVSFDRKFPLENMHPSVLDSDREPTLFYFTPMHFNERCFGYSVLMLRDPTGSLGTIYSQWMRNVNNSLESIRRRTNLTHMYNRMEESAVMDITLGIMNRNGFNLYSIKQLKKAIENNENIVVIIGDLNCLKYINDTFGHVAGDNALMISANAFKSSAEGMENAMNFRIGGDEFVQILTGNLTDRDVNLQIKKIRDYLDRYNATAGQPYPVLLGIGCYCKHAAENDTIDSLITRADKAMFSNKQEIKKKSGFNFNRK